MGKYRKRPIVIEAFQMTVDRRVSNEDWPEWLITAWQKDRGEINSVYPTGLGNLDGTVSIGTLEGSMDVNFGDYIIRGIAGELYPCKPHIFKATYEAVDDNRSEVLLDRWYDGGNFIDAEEHMRDIEDGLPIDDHGFVNGTFHVLVTFTEDL